MFIFGHRAHEVASLRQQRSSLQVRRQSQASHVRRLQACCLPFAGLHETTSLQVQACCSLYTACVHMQLDERFLNAVGLIRNGTFGWEDFFEPLVESITSGGDYYLLANDFPAYIDCQVPSPNALLCFCKLQQAPQAATSLHACLQHLASRRTPT